MTMRKWWLGSTLGWALGWSLTAARAQEQPPPDPFPPVAAGEVGIAQSSLDALALAVQGLVDRDELVGAELLVIKDDRTVLHRAFGWKDREERVAMERDTLFCVRSMTKAVVGTAAQMALEDDRLELRDPVAKHLPSFDTEARRGVTVEHLLRHTSGLRLSSLITADLAAVASLRDVANLAAAGEPLFTPGERWSYSDDGADVLGALIESAVWMPLERMLRERLFEPLGMRDTLTFVTAEHERRARIASNYMGSKGNWTRYWKPGDASLFPIVLASQGLYCTPRDYARFLALWKERGLVGGKRLLRSSTVERALAPAVLSNHPTGFSGVEVHWGEMWVLWVDASKPDEREVLAFGHGGSDGTFSYVFPALDLMVLQFSQSRNNHTFVQFESALQEHLIDPLRGRVLARPIEYGAAELDAIAGIYWEEDDAEPLAVERAGGGLIAEFPGRARHALKPTPTRDRFDFTLVRDAWMEVERDADGLPRAVIGHRGGAAERHPRLEPSAELPSASDVLELRERSIDFARVRALGPLRFEGRFELSVGGKSGAMKVLCDGWERSRSEMAGGGFDMNIALDGDQAWTAGGGRAATAEDDASVERLRFNHVLFAVSDWRPRFVELRVLARVEREGVPHTLLRGTTRHGNARYLVVDAASGRLREERRIEPDMGVGEIGATVTYADWRAVGEVELPMRITYSFASKLVGTFDVRFERVEPAGELAPDAFRLQAR